jgi:antirestriction protein ArdC
LLRSWNAAPRPWVKPWSATVDQNVPQSRLATPRFLTYKQAVEAGGHVRRGEHGTKVYFVKQLQIKVGDDEDAEARLIPLLREYTVFNVKQFEGLPARVLAPRTVKARSLTHGTRLLTSSWRAAARVRRSLLPAELCRRGALSRSCVPLTAI